MESDTQTVYCDPKQATKACFQQVTKAEMNRPVASYIVEEIFYDGMAIFKKAI